MQPEHPYEHRPDAIPEHGDTLGEVLTALDELITEIEDAPAGSDALDARIHFGFRVTAGRSQDVASLLISEGISWPIVKAALDEVIPPFTTSLDASLDGERIVFVLRSAKRNRWGAMQRANSGEEVLGWAQTEPLARRLTALKSWRADIEVAIKTTEAAAVSVVDEAAPEPAPVVSLSADQVIPASQISPEVISDDDASSTMGTAAPDDNEDKDWEVLF